jgi:hypothetical protein
MPSKGSFAQLTSWSYSVYAQYLKCPFSVCLDKIMRTRITEPPNPNFIKGNRFHAIADTFIAGVGRKRPELVETVQVPGTRDVVKVDLTSIKDELTSLREKGARTEQNWAFDRRWNPVDWRDWDNAWVRIKTDACADTIDPPTVDIVDWKTGRVYPDHKQQRSLYALGGLRLVQLGVLAGGSKKVELTARHIYGDTGQTATEKFLMRHLEPLKREWLARIKEMMADTTYVAKPSAMNCRYCKFNKKNGGPCQKGV